jgi:hypothetical protein
MFVPLDLCKLSNKQNVFQLAEAIHFAFRIFVHSLSFQICLSCLVETSFYDRLWMLCSSQSKDQKQLNAGTKTAKGGIPLANGDAQLQRPPPWAYPLQPDVQQPNTQQLLRSASKAIDRAMAHLWESKLKVVDVSFSIELRKPQSAARQMETLKFEQRKIPDHLTQTKIVNILAQALHLVIVAVWKENQENADAHRRVL